MARDQRLQESEGPGRRLWRVDLNDVHVVDEAGVEYGVEMTRGDLNGPLRVMIRSEDVPLSVSENLAAALEHIAESSAHPSMTVRSTSYLGEVARKALVEYRAAYPGQGDPVSLWDHLPLDALGPDDETRRLIAGEDGREPWLGSAWLGADVGGDSGVGRDRGDD